MSHPSPSPAPSPAAQAKPERNTVGLIALAAAVLGSAFAVIEGAYIVGWILLPVAFVLALVALLQRDKGKKAAVWALVITLVGTLAGAIAFMSSVGKAVDQAFNQPNTIGTSAPASPGAPAPGPAASTQMTQGTRDNPLPLGTPVENDEWKVVVNSVDLDATKKVLAANPYNAKPGAGETYALVNVTITRRGADAQTPLFVGVDYVTSAGNVVQSSDAPVIAPDALKSNDLFKDATTTGTIALKIPQGDAGTLRVQPGLLAQEVFYAVK